MYVLKPKIGEFNTQSELMKVDLTLGVYCTREHNIMFLYDFYLFPSYEFLSSVPLLYKLSFVHFSFVVSVILLFLLTMVILLAGHQELKTPGTRLLLIVLKMK